MHNNSVNLTRLNSNLNVKKVLLWNKLIGDPLMLIENGLLSSIKCPVNNCEITSDRPQLNQSDYILFHMRRPIREFPQFRFSYQKWVYVVYESQQHCPMCTRLEGLFNVSATFRRNSDMTSIYVSNCQLVWSDAKQP